MTHDWTLPAPPNALTIRLGLPEDVDALTELYEEAERWQRARGIDPGKAPLPMREIVARRVANGSIYLARVGGVPAATVALTWDDHTIWPDAGDDAGYLHGVAVARAFAGQRVGRAILRWAEGYIASQGKSFARLDCNGNNPTLRAYYEAAGYHHRGDVFAGRLASRYEKRVR